MSMDVFSAHLYGAITDSTNTLRPELEETFGDIYELRGFFNDGEYDEFPTPVPEIAKGLEMIVGPDDIIYIGVPAMMPFEKPHWSKDEIDAAVAALGKYLFGDDTKLTCDDIYEAWVE